MTLCLKETILFRLTDHSCRRRLVKFNTRLVLPMETPKLSIPTTLLPPHPSYKRMAETKACHGKGRQSDIDLGPGVFARSSNPRLPVLAAAGTQNSQPLSVCGGM